MDRPSLRKLLSSRASSHLPPGQLASLHLWPRVDRDARFLPRGHRGKTARLSWWLGRHSERHGVGPGRGPGESRFLLQRAQPHRRTRSSRGGGARALGRRPCKGADPVAAPPDTVSLRDALRTPPSPVPAACTSRLEGFCGTWPPPCQLGPQGGKQPAQGIRQIYPEDQVRGSQGLNLL